MNNWIHKTSRTPKTKQSLIEFTTKLSAKWSLLTTPLKSSDADAAEEQSLEDIFRHLIGIPTTSGNYAATHDALSYIEQYLHVRGMHTTRLEFNGLESLIATTRKTKTPKVMLAAHVDVVPAAEEAFELRETKDRFLGRGTLDMKFAIAAYLKIIDELKDSMQEYDLGIMITPDEEAGGMDGTRQIVKAGHIPKVCILPDGGDNWQIQTASKGFFYMSVSAQGSPAHGSRPWLGENAILKLVAIISEIQKLFPNQDPEGSTINFGKIQGGEAVNQVAEYAEVSLDGRFVDEASKLDAIAKIERICDKHAAKLTMIISGASTSFDLTNPYIAPFAELITEVTGVEVKGSRTLGSNDLRYFAEYDVPCISVYPPGGGHHGPEEWISKEGFHQFKEVLQKYLEKIARVDK